MVNDYVALDLETTGLNPKRDRMIEVGAVKVRNGMVTETFQSLVNPGRALNETVCELTGITEEMLKNAPDEDEVLGEILDFIGEDVLVGHRILFDYSFLKRLAVNRKLVFERKGIDTLKLARKFLPELESRRLSCLCVYYGIEHTAHRALGDAGASSKLYQKLAELYYNEKDFAPQELIFRIKKETPISKPQKERLYKLLDKHKIAMEYDIDKLTKNEASRITDQILSKYGR